VRRKVLKNMAQLRGKQRRSHSGENGYVGAVERRVVASLNVVRLPKKRKRNSSRKGDFPIEGFLS